MDMRRTSSEAAEKERWQEYDEAQKESERDQMDEAEEEERIWDEIEEEVRAESSGTPDDSNAVSRAVSTNVSALTVDERELQFAEFVRNEERRLNEWHHVYNSVAMRAARTVDEAMPEWVQLFDPAKRVYYYFNNC